MNLEKELKEYLGFDEFRPGQKEVIETALAKRNCFAMLPTGTGKTICYQLAGHLMDGLVLIVSPLLSLMQDQMERMRAHGEKRVAALNSFLKREEKGQVLANIHLYKFIFLSPEMLNNETVKNLLLKQRISLFVIDEAHCISQWGHDFRPDYLMLGKFIQEAEFPVTMVLTATATKKVRADILTQLHLTDCAQIVYSVNRPNISLQVEKFSNQHVKKDRLYALVRKLQTPGIIYFSSKKLAESTAHELSEIADLRVAYYHGDMDTEDRIIIQQQFVYGQLDVICATSAFGMGIDKADIRYVIHYHMPADLEAYLQEIGRAGRDGENSVAILLYANGDEFIQMQLADQDIPDANLMNLTNEQRKTLPETEQRFIEYYQRSGLSTKELTDKMDYRKKWKRANLQQFIGYLHTTDCRRNYILRYFEETPLEVTPENCCDLDGAEIIDFEKRPITKQKEIPTWEAYLAYLLQ
ncbi:TPA_asm: RecQ family ATP-dependent DNA helicase [Listeria monocytogenes]|uniref:RecQ family ATP-dependent DNA helicase n=1 Tax=Listeria monocytogenes TaxID=1639 RepID=UPI000E763728|nr:ATP-dependent DNA helicase RecQ [Listeria monocytogenes]EAE3765871.1 ATP-dependent DNA helicase RecQ [Listeria monocytogenes serotype 1/2b]EAC3673725.1 ATP-dependent DNA helicase RecQ [Listeria monocytogenes]EAC4458369.1 ATP-dependent DNA helicase RecQ [Listeria monocytogenes]EAC5143018.1 ATP-dependent DNA helicase RecQ [Listeria monocytogenes]EAC6251546.1 ATP-dependent DNA helicase RecQ [Listeria monocytogenes]